MRIAILGATSQIAKDLVLSFATQSRHELVLYARRPEAVTQWLRSVGFSHTQDMAARFLITDILRAIRGKTVLQTSSDHIVLDYLHPSDFYQLVSVLLAAPAANIT